MKTMRGRKSKSPRTTRKPTASERTSWWRGVGKCGSKGTNGSSYVVGWFPACLDRPDPLLQTTHEQIAQARDSLILRLALQRWRQRTAARQDLYVRVCTLSDKRCLKAAMDVWKTKLKEKKQADWRDAMRARMKTVRERREAKLLKDAWAKWRQSYQSHLSEQHYNERLVTRCLKRWRARLARLDQLDAAAEHLEYVRQERQVERCWDLWRRALDMRKRERVMAGRVDMRVVGQVVDAWRRRLYAGCCLLPFVADRSADSRLVQQMSSMTG